MSGIPIKGESKIEGKVVRVLSPTELVVNLGADHRVTPRTTFVVFTTGEELNDPDTGESLGQLEIVRGRAEAKHVQAKMSTIRSIEKKTMKVDRRREAPRELMVFLRPDRPDIVTEDVEVVLPFEGVQVGDLVRAE